MTKQMFHWCWSSTAVAFHLQIPIKSNFVNNSKLFDFWTYASMYSPERRKKIETKNEPGYQKRKKCFKFFPTNGHAFMPCYFNLPFFLVEKKSFFVCCFIYFYLLLLCIFYDQITIFDQIFIKKSTICIRNFK